MRKNREDRSLVPDRGNPIDISYTLTADDVYNALKTSRIYRKNFIKATIESGILMGLVILFGVWWIIWDDGNAMIFCIAFACLIGVVWAVVLFSIRTTCNRLVTGETITMQMDFDSVTVGNGIGASWEIPLDGTIPCEEKNDILILYTDTHEWTLIPLNAIDAAKREQVRSRILQNTKRLVK